MNFLTASKSRTLALTFDSSALVWGVAAPDAAPGDVVKVRALSWLEWQEADALVPSAQISRVLELGVVEVGGVSPAAFLADPLPVLVAGLYRQIADLTWGNG